MTFPLLQFVGNLSRCVDNYQSSKILLSGLQRNTEKLCNKCLYTDKQCKRNVSVFFKAPYCNVIQTLSRIRELSSLFSFIFRFKGLRSVLAKNLPEHRTKKTSGIINLSGAVQFLQSVRRVLITRLGCIQGNDTEAWRLRSNLTDCILLIEVYDGDGVCESCAVIS